MMSRMTIKLQRSPTISSVKLIGQPERISLLVCSFFMNSMTTCSMHGVWVMFNLLAKCK